MHIKKKFIALSLSILLSLQPIDNISAVTVFNEDISENIATEENYADYIKISTWQELNNIRNNLSGKYVLTSDITWPNEQNWIPIENFSGVLDGNGYRINNLTMHQQYSKDVNDGEYDDIGLFASTYNAIIKNVALINVDFNIVSTAYGKFHTSFAGSIIGDSRNTTIDNCYCTGNMVIDTSKDDSTYSFTKIGGFIGCSKNCNISNCYSLVNVDMKNHENDLVIGGMIGSLNEGSIANCYCGATKILGNNNQNNGSVFGFAGSYYALKNIIGIYYSEITGLSDKQANALTESKMMEISNFVGYENTGLWITDDTSSYPYPQLSNNPQVRVTNIELTDMGNLQATYTVGDKLNIENAYVSITYEDGTIRKRKVTEKMISGLDLSKSGVQTCYIKWLNGTTSFTINVKEVEAKSISLDLSEIQMDVYKTKQLTATISPENTTNQTVTWSSDNTNVATVSEKGLVKAINLGEATITASTANGVVATCKVVVGISVKSFILNETEAMLTAGDTLQLKGEFNPVDATLTDLTWESTNEDVAVVDDNGKVTAMTSGSTTIIATTVNGLTAECDVSVKIPVSKIKVNISSVTLKKGKTKQLTVKIYPSNASDKPKFSSLNKKVATVSNKGKITAKKKGTTYIKVVVGKCTKKIKVKVR